jgi:hypothetical protein
MCEIPLRRRDGTLHGYALIDDEDAHLAQFTWSLARSGGRNKLYVQRRDGKTYVKLHRVIMGCQPGDGLEVDHRNGDALDNRRANLRISTHSLNCQNLPSRAGATSRHRGVSWDAKRGKWFTKATLDGRQIYLGVYDDEEVAARVVEAWRAENMPFSKEAADAA